MIGLMGEIRFGINVPKNLGDDEFLRDLALQVIEAAELVIVE